MNRDEGISSGLLCPVTFANPPCHPPASYHFPQAEHEVALSRVQSRLRDREVELEAAHANLGRAEKEAAAAAAEVAEARRAAAAAQSGSTAEAAAARGEADVLRGEVASLKKELEAERTKWVVVNRGNAAGEVCKVVSIGLQKCTSDVILAAG